MASTSVLRSAMANALNNISQTLLQNQKAIDIVNNNIANINTEGYSRVETQFTSLPTGGTLLSSAKRVFDKMIFTRLLNANQEKSYHKSLDNTLYQLESLFKDTLGGGFSKQIDEFYLSLNDVITSPDSLPARKSFLNSSKILAGRINSIGNSLEDMSEITKKSFRETVTNINNLLQHISKINKEIKYFSKDETKLNSYLDQRDQVLKKLSSLLDIKINFNRNQTVDIFTSKGHRLVLQDKVQPLRTTSSKVTMSNSYLLKTANTLTSPTESITDTGTLTINYKLNNEDKTYSIDYQNRSLLEIAKQINSSEDLNANVINVGSQTDPDYRLVISTKFKNEENVINSIEDSDGNDSSGFDISNSNEIYRKNYSKTEIRSGAVDLTDLFQYGKLASLIKSEKTINQTFYNVDRFAQDFAYQINSIHRLGYNLNGETGEDLFINSDTGNGLGIDSLNISLNFDDPTKLAAGISQNNSADNTLAKALEHTKDNEMVYYDTSTGDLQKYNKPDFLDNLTFSDFYSSKIVTDIALERQYNNDRLEDTSLLYSTLDDKMQEISGVNLDEELVKLTQLQRSYQATARVIMVTDELFKTLIEMTR
ncbi:flagellar hook-associated protein FlgK [Nitrosophilus kaiyonis]|uniref:flagellar hook-associated protein FlgK n=1 Tax=Nitrosophilus kaiyonis TaxID=2930200 RepID=UPI002490B33B|nr:flagellar hook-associated protein FlgK [Nitrosophilus kaiyonis]